MINPPSSGDPVYLVAVGIVFIAGLLAVLATLWVAREPRKRRTAKKKIMYASVAPFILGLVLNVYAYKLKK
jgi:ABC-type spermidine/putrescine transport system permease subunit II